MDVQQPTNNPTTLFEGFSLERSTSFSEENDEIAAAKFEEHQLARAPKNLQQKYTKQEYDEVMLVAMDKKKHFPLERKPFVLEKNGKVLSSDHHIEEIKQKNS